jgi:Fe-S-cluster containining protein
MIPSNCSRCGYCCTLRARLGFFEYLKLLLLGYRNFSDKNLKGERFIKLDKKCFFLDGNRCRIYENRPKACREYPGVDRCPKG